MGDQKLLSAEDDARAFDQLFDVLQKDLMSADFLNEDTADAFKWFHRVNKYNVPHGKKNRGLTVVQSLRFLSDSNNLTEDDLKRAAIVGWCIEWLQAFFLVADDIMDSSHMRRGQPCWYKVDGVGLRAINDSFYLETALYFLLKKYLKDQSYYVEILDLFHETTFQTVTGQALDLLTAPPGDVDFSLYTKKRYKAIVKYKTAFYSFYLPVACAMYMAGITRPELHEEAKQVLLQMGEFFQIQDDYLDCYGDPAIMGKIGTDIEEAKCSWLIVQALSLATKEQLAILQENYGRHEKECVARVKEIYETLKIKELYANFEESSYTDIIELINKLSSTLSKEMFLEYARKIYRRMK